MKSPKRRKPKQEIRMLPSVGMPAPAAILPPVREHLRMLAVTKQPSVHGEADTGLAVAQHNSPCTEPQHRGPTCQQESVLMNQSSGQLTPAHKRLIELVARRAYESLKASNGQSVSTTPEPQPPSIRVLRLKDVEQKVGLKKTQIYHLMDQKQFPQTMKLGVRAIGWLEHEIDAYLMARAAQRDDASA